MKSSCLQNSQLLTKTLVICVFWLQAISSREDLPNIWRFAILRDSEIIFDQLLMVRFDGFLGTANELSFLTYILAASPVLKKMTIVPVEGQLQKSTRTYRKLLKSKTLSSEAAITFVWDELAGILESFKHFAFTAIKNY